MDDCRSGNEAPACAPISTVLQMEGVMPTHSFISQKKKCVHIYIQKVHHEGKFSRIQHTQCVSVLHTDVCDKILGFDSMAIRPSCRIRKKITKG